MTAVQVLDALWLSGATVRVDGPDLVIRPPPGVRLPAELIVAARERKADLLALVAAFDACACAECVARRLPAHADAWSAELERWPTDAREAWAERVAIMLEGVLRLVSATQSGIQSGDAHPESRTADPARSGIN